MTDPLLEPLNEQQRAVVLATHGPVLVLAGAGSGKTRALTHRIAYLLRERIARPSEILAVTFTNKAAHEMKERVAGLLKGKSYLPSAIGTFHSICARILRECAKKHNAPLLNRSASFVIFDTSEGEGLVRQALREANLSPRELSPRQLLSRISHAKNKQITPEDIAAQSSGQADDVLARVFSRYEALLLKNDAFDFDDLLLWTIRILGEYEELRKQYQQRWRFISVDEYQDTNPIQDRLLSLLLGPEKNLCVVGDDYQAIYSWRGAQVDHILRFEKNFPNCTALYLTQNYRSTPSILEAANMVIAENEEQKHKTLWTEKKKGEPVHVLALPDDRHEAMWVRQQTTKAHDEGTPLSDFAILYRTNAQSRVFEEEFLRYQVPYTIVGGFRFYERREVKDALALLQFWLNPKASLGLARLAEALWRGIGPKTLMRWEKTMDGSPHTLLDLLAMEAEKRPLLKPFVNAYREAREETWQSVAHLLRFLLHHSGYLSWLKRQPDAEERGANIDELLNVTTAYSDVATFLQEVSLLSDIDTLKEKQDRVTCMTLHASKGLEFPRVFVVGCEEGLLPHQGSIDSRRELEEERRLLYVGMTRAKETLYLTYAATRFVRGDFLSQLPSRFLETLPATVLRHDENTVSEEEVAGVDISDDLKAGSIIEHPMFGEGVVIEKKGSLVSVIFEGYGLKTIDRNKVALYQPE